MVLIELFGGMAAGLEALLRNGVSILRYLYSDISVPAQQVAAFRCMTLHHKYPNLLPLSAFSATFTTGLPMDVHTITPAILSSAGALLGDQWIVIAGPECKDFSPAGNSVGATGFHARTMVSCIQVIGALQQLQPRRPPFYIIENAAMQHNWRSATIRDVDFPNLCA
jgi:site-specific DNA-cytosine methylase